MTVAFQTNISDAMAKTSIVCNSMSLLCFARIVSVEIQAVYLYLHRLYMYTYCSLAPYGVGPTDNFVGPQRPPVLLLPGLCTVKAAS